VYSWSSKHNFWKERYPVPIIRTKDHALSSINYEEDSEENIVKIVSKGTALLLDAEKGFLLFKTELGDIFSLKNLRGKRYIFTSIK